MAESFASSIQSGNFASYAGAVAGSLVFGAIGKSASLGLASRMGKSAYTFGGGFIQGTVEFGLAGFGVGFGGALGGGASLKDAAKAGAKVATVSGTIGGVIQGSYMAGWQNTLHGNTKAEVAKAQAARSALNTDQSLKVTLKGRADRPTGRTRNKFLGKGQIHPLDTFTASTVEGTLAGKSTPGGTFIPVEYSYVHQREMAQHVLEFEFKNSNWDLIRKTKIDGTERWEDVYHFKQIHWELGGTSPDVRFDFENK
jgi:hypothetical protein